MSRIRPIVFGCLLAALVLPTADAKPFIDTPSRIQAALRGGGGATGQLVVLTHNGQPAATIILPVLAPPTTVMVSQFLVEYVEQMSGARLEVVTDPAQVRTPHRIWVGMRPEISQRFPGVNFQFTQPEEILMVARPGELVLVGRDVIINDDPVQAGTVLCVTTFIEERLGVRWLWPGQWGTDLYESANIAFAPFEYRYSPQMGHRNPRSERVGPWVSRLIANESRRRVPGEEEMVEQYLGGYDNWVELARQRDVDNKLWFNMHRVRAERTWNSTTLLDQAMQGALRYRSGHAFSSWYERFAKDHPDWFALQPDGQRASRQANPYPTAERVKLCISNPEVAQQWLEDATAYFNANPDAVFRSAAPNDYGWRGYCVCDNCKAWDSPDGPMLARALEWRGLNEPHYALTDRYVRFWNILAAGLRERFPDRDVRIGVWAYRAYEPAPHRQQLDAAVVPGYVGIILRNPSSNYRERIERDLATWRGWIEKGAGGMVWRPNSLKRSAGLFHIYPHRLGDLMNQLAEEKILGYELDTVIHHWANQGPHLYVMTKLLWNPRLKTKDILEDYYLRAFGPDAAPYIYAYYAVFEQLYCKLAETYGPPGSPRQRLFEHLPRAYRQEKLGPTFNRNMANHVWGNYLWELPNANHTAEELAAAYLRRAEQAVARGPQKYRERVAYVRIGWEYAQAQLDAIQAMNEWRSHRDSEEHTARAMDAVARRERLLIQNAGNSAIGVQSWHGSRPTIFGPPGQNPVAEDDDDDQTDAQ